MARALRVGVVGLGMGKGHVKSFREHPQVEVAAVCDLDADRLENARKEFGIAQVYRDAGKMFAKAGLDAVCIATPNKFHAPLTISALRSGLHVLCEKPMAMNEAEARQMKAESEKSGRTLMINFSYRFSQMSYALKQQVESGALGDIYYGRSVWHRRRGIPGFGGWFGNKELSGGGPLIDLSVHRLDLALWLMGFPRPVTVSGTTYDLLGRERAKAEGKVFTVEDLAAAMIRFDNGATLILEASWALNIGENEQMTTTLCGTKGGLVQRNTDGGYSFTAEVFTEEDGYLYTKRLDRSSKPVPPSCHEFANSILENRAPLATADQGITVMRILDAVYESARRGHEIRFEAENYCELDMPARSATARIAAKGKRKRRAA
jgi:predicted dehydrogenase